jgi:hypothetical protein
MTTVRSRHTGFYAVPVFDRAGTETAPRSDEVVPQFYGGPVTSATNPRTSPLGSTSELEKATFDKSAKNGECVGRTMCSTSKRWPIISAMPFFAGSGAEWSPALSRSHPRSATVSALAQSRDTFVYPSSGRAGGGDEPSVRMNRSASRLQTAVATIVDKTVRGS